MAVTTHIHESPNFQVDKVSMTFKELTELEQKPVMPIRAGNLSAGQLAVVTNARVLPVLDGGHEGRHSNSARPADIRLGGKYYSLTTNPDADRTSASYLIADRALPDGAPAILANDQPTVADFHGRSLYQLHFPGQESMSVHGLMKSLGVQAPRMLENLDIVDGFTYDYIYEGGHVGGDPGAIWGPYPDDPRSDSSVHGYGIHPDQGFIPERTGIIALLAARANEERPFDDEGPNEVLVAADTGVMAELLSPSISLDKLGNGIAETLGAEIVTRLTLIDMSGIDAVLPYSTLSQYDLIAQHAEVPDRRVHLRPNMVIGL